MGLVEAKKYIQDLHKKQSNPLSLAGLFDRASGQGCYHKKNGRSLSSSWESILSAI